MASMAGVLLLCATGTIAGIQQSDAKVFDDNSRAAGRQSPVRQLLQSPDCNITAFVSESTKVRNLRNALTFTFSPSCSLQAASSIVISGIPASISRDSVPVHGTILGFVARSTARASPGSNGLDLELTLNQEMVPGCGYTIEVTFSNPPTERPPSSMPIQLKAVYANTGQESTCVVMSDASLMVPAQVLRGQLSNTFTIRRVSESSGVSGALNVLTFTLQPDYPLPVGTLIRIDGLAGSLTPTNYWYNNSVEVSTAQGCASSAAEVEWEPAAGRCRILNPNGVCINVHEQPSPVCSFHRMQVSGADGDLFGFVTDWFNYGSLILNCTKDLGTNMTCMDAAAPSEFSITLQNPSVARAGQTPRVGASSSSIDIDPQGLTLLPEAPYPFVLGGREANGFVAASVSEETDMVAVANALSFAMTANVDIAAGSTLRILGLTGTRTPGSSLSVQGPSASVFAARAAQWDRMAGTLNLPVTSDVTAGQQLQFGVTLTNQEYAINPRTVYAAMSGATAIPQKRVEGGVLASGGGIQWRGAVVSEASDVQGAVNVLSFRFIPSVALPNATRILLSGLAGVTLKAVSDAAVPLGGPDADKFTAATFDAAAGTLVFAARVAVSTFCATEVSVEVLNAVARRTSPTLFLAADGILPIPPTPLICKEVPCQVLRAAVNATWDTRAVAESSVLPGSANTITVSLSPAITLPTGTAVTIAGLTGSATASTAALALSGSGAALFGGSGVWDQAAGTLALASTSEWAHGSTAVFTFDLDNPASPQNASSPTVTGVVDGAAACPTFGACTRSYQSMTLGPQPMFGAVLAASDQPVVTLATMAEDSAVRGFLNTLTVSLAVNRALGVGASLTISGLTGTQEYLPAWAPFGPDSGKLNLTKASWDFTAGTAVAEFIEAVPASQTLAFSFRVRNGNAAQTAVVPTVAFNDASAAAIASGTFSSSVLAFTASVLLTETTITENTDQLGNENEISFSLTPNHPIPAGSRITIGGLSNARRDANDGTFSSGTAQLLGGSDAALFSSSRGTWISSSEVVLSVASEIPSSCTSTVSLINVYNPRTPALASAIDVAVFGTAYAFCGLGNATDTGALSSWLTNISVCVQATQADCPGIGQFNLGQCAYPSLQSQRTATQAGLASSGAIMTSNGTNAFVVALVSEASDLTGRSNTITFTLRPRGSIRSGETITISGLENSGTATTANLRLSGSGASSFTGRPSGIFDANAGLLTMTTRRDIPATNDLVFSITLTNPDCPCVTVTTFPCPNNASLTCSSSTARAATIPSVEVSEEPYKLAKKSLTNPVLVGDKNASWLRLGVSESHSIQGVSTLVTFRLASSHTVPAGEVLTITGFQGAQNATGDPITASPRGWIGSRSWNPAAGSLTLTAGIATLPGQSLDFTVCMLQAQTVQGARIPAIRSTVVFPAATSIPIGGSGSFLEATERIRFLVASVHESARTRSAFNTISISLRPNLAFGETATLTVSGLGVTAEGLVDQTIALDGSSAAIFGGTATLTGAGLLQLQVAPGQALPDDSTTVVQFTYQNPSSGSSRVTSSPRLSGIWRTAPSIDCPTSQMPNVLLVTDMLLTVANQATPGSLMAPSWSVASVLEGSKIPSTPNTLEFRLQPRHDLLQRTELVIEGLRNSATPSTSCLPLGGTHRHLFVGSCGTWAASGSLSLTVADGQTLERSSEAIVSITLMNPASSQAARNVAIKVGGSTFNRTEGSPAFNGAVSVVGGGGVLSASETATWERAWVSQDSCAKGGVNELTVQLQTNAPLFTGSSVVVSGLDEASSLTSTGALTGLSAAKFGSVGTWSNPGSFTVTIAVNQTADPGEVLVFSFQVKNPAQVSAGSTPVVRAVDASARSWVPQAAMTSPGGVPPWVLVTGLDPAIAGSIVGSSEVYSAPNAISLHLTPNARLIPGDEVTVSGLAASQTPSGSVAVAGADAARVASASFDQCRGTLTMVVSQLGIAPDSTVVVEVTLINPSFPREPAPASVSSTRTALTELEGRVLSPTVHPQLIWRNITGASPVLGNKNALTVTLMANYMLRAGHRVTLAGFTTALEADNAVLPITTAAAQSNLLPASVNFSRPTSSLEIVIQSDVPAGTVLPFAFPLTNPTTAMFGREPRISTGPFPPIAPVAMYHNEGVLAPTRSGAWTTASISDSQRTQGAQTLLTVDLSADSELPVGAQIVISGLVGPQASATPSVSSSPSVLSAQGAWDACAGELALTVESALAAGSALSFQFSPDNPFAALSPGSQPMASVRSSTVSVAPTAMTLSSAAFLSSLLPPSWVTASVFESVSVPGESSLITFTLLPSVTLPPGTVVVISGLEGTQTEDNSAMPLEGTGKDLFVSAQGDWQRATGSLTLTVASDVPGCSDGLCAATTFGIQAINPASAQPTGATAVVSALGSTPGLEFNKTVMQGSPILGAGSTFAVASVVSLSSEVKGAYSEISVILTPNVDVFAGEAVILSGLSGFSTPSSTLELSGAQASFFGYNSVAGRASWSSCNDALEMTVMSGVSFGPSTSNPSVELQFTLRNPSFRTTTSLDLTLGSRSLQQLRSNIVVGHKDPTWSSTFASQDNTVMSQLNTIKLGFQANTVLVPSTVVTISGLEGSHTTGSNSIVTLSGGDAASFSSQARWTQSSGTLTMTVASGTYVTARAMTTVQVSLQNADVAVLGTDHITLEATCSLAGEGCIDIPLQQKQLASTILAPVTAPAFTVRCIGETVRAQGEASTITVTLTANCQLPEGSTVTISGLKDYLEASNTAYPISDSLSIGTGTWVQEEGTMALVMPTGGIASGQSMVISFTLTNGFFYSADYAPTQAVSASNSDGFAIDAQSFELQACGQTTSIAAFSHVGSFTVAEIWQDTQVQGALSSFTIDVQPSYDIPSGSVLTISGLRGSRTPYTPALPLYGNGAGFFSDIGDWDNLSGTLRLTMASVMSNRYPTRVSFDLVNPARAQLARQAVVSTSVVPAAAMTPPPPADLPAGYGTDILSGAAPPLLSLSLSESSQLQGHANTITVSLQLSATARSPASVVISNLPVTQTPRALALPVGGPSAHVFGHSLVWDPCAGQARLRAPGGLPVATALVFNFTVVNARTPQAPPSWCAQLGLPTCIQVSVLGDGGESLLPALAPRAVLSAAQSLQLLTNTLEISTFAPGDLNDLTFTIETNALLPAGALIVISNLSGAVSPPDLIPDPSAPVATLGGHSLGLPGLIPLRFDNTSAATAEFTGNASRWDPARGRITIVAAADIPPGTPLRFSLSLLNPVPNLPRTQPALEIASPFFLIPAQSTRGPPFEVDTVPPSQLSLTLVSYSSDLASVRDANLSLLLTEPSQAVCLLQKASAVVPSVDAVRTLGVHVQPPAGAETNLTDTGLTTAPRLLASTGWVVVGPVFSGIRHAVYCHFRDLAQIPNEAPESVLETNVLEFTTPSSYLPKGAAAQIVPNRAILAASSLVAAILVAVQGAR